MNSYLISLLKPTLRFLPAFALTVLISLAPDLASAAPGGFVTCEGASCSACDLVKMVNLIIVWLFGIIFLIFAVLMLMAGFGLVTSGGDTSAVSAAKSKFKNALIGLLIVMAAWLLVDTMVTKLVNGGDGNLAGAGFKAAGPWSEVKCQVQTVPKPPKPQPVGGVTATTTTATTTGGVFRYSNNFNSSVQITHASPGLNEFQGCVASKIPSGNYFISSISDDKIANEGFSFIQCAQGKCAHAANSCHYGGSGKCNGKSYALDVSFVGINDEQKQKVVAAAKNCGGWGQIESNHIHISVGNKYGCGCN